MVPHTGSFVILVPVKSPGTAKSRMATLPDVDRARLASAFATDVVDACLRSPKVAEVLVVSDDPDFAAELAARGAATCADPGAGLNGALRHGAEIAHQRWPELRPVALCADLPALSAGDLTAALEFAATNARTFVRDADTTGTTLYTTTYADFDPRFGVGSAERHAVDATDVPARVPTLRRDVDDLDDLRQAVTLGVGDATSLALQQTRIG